MTSTRCILNALDSYQKSKLTFLQYLYDYTLKKDCNVDQLAELNVIEQIVPLLNDSPNVRSLALTTTVKLCVNSGAIARQILEKKLICHLGDGYESQSKEYKRNVLHIVKNVSKHADLTLELLEQGKELLSAGIHDVDPPQREFVLNAATNICSYNVCTAQQVINLDILPQVMLCLQCPENISLEAMQLIRALAKLSDALITNQLIGNNVIPLLADHLNSNDGKIIKQALLCLIEFTKSSLDYTWKILVTPSILCKTILYMSHCDASIRKTAVVLIKEFCKFNAEMSKAVVQHGALPGLITAVANPNSAGSRLPAVLALGYMGAQCSQLALTIIHCQGLAELISAFNSETKEASLKAIVWTIEKLTGHSAHHVTYLSKTNVFARLLRLYLSTNTCPELKEQCFSALQRTVNKCLSIQDIDLLLYESPPEILLPAIKQLIKILSVEPRSRRLFVSTGGLQRIQTLKPVPGSELCEAIVTLNAQFPDDIVRYYAQRIGDRLIAQIENYTPNVSAADCSSDKPLEKATVVMPEENENFTSPPGSILSFRSDPGIFPGLVCSSPPEELTSEE